MSKYNEPYDGPQTESSALARIAIALTHIANEKAIANDIEKQKMEKLK